MEKNGLLSVAQRHIPGGKQRKQVYTLTESGREQADALAQNILAKGVKEATAPFNSKASGTDHAALGYSLTLMGPSFTTKCTGFPRLQPGGHGIHRCNTVRIGSSNVCALGRMEKSPGTNNPLNEVVEFLGMHPERVRRLSNEARNRQIPPPEEVYYVILQALDDVEILQDEIDLLDTFRIHFGIGQLTHNSLWSEPEPPNPSPNTTTPTLLPSKRP